MAFADKLTVVIDFVTGPAQSGMAKLRTEVRQAEGAVGKLKAGAGALGGALQTHVAGAALAAGGALVAFGVKSVQAFTDGALAAAKFADATGIAIEDASRWISVAGDIGVEAGVVQGAFQRMNKAIADGKPELEQFADAIVRADDGTVNASETFRMLSTRVMGINDATERAAAAQAIFGRSYGEMSRLVSKSSAELQRALLGTQEAEVFTPEDRARAERYEAAMDTLGDTVVRLKNNFGGSLVPTVSRTAESFAKAANAVQDLDGAISDLTGTGLVDFVSPLDNISSGLQRVFGDNVSVVDRFKGGVELVASAFPGVSEAVSDVIGPLEEANAAISNFVEWGTEESAEIATIYGERIPDAANESTSAIGKVRDATADAEAKALNLETQWAHLFGMLDSEKALLSLERQFDDLYEAGVKAYAAGVEGSDDAAKAQIDHRLAIVETKDEVARYAQEVLGLPVERVTDILADIDRGKLDEVERKLGILSRNRTVSLDIIASGGAGYELGFGGRRAAGGPVNPGKAYLVGEQGPEVIIPNQPGMVVPNSRLGTVNSANGMVGNAPMIVNVTTGADPEDVVRAIERYKRRNGSLPFQ